MKQFHEAPNTFVSQVDLKVENLERSLTFYKNIIGFQVLEQSENKAVLTADGKTPLLSIEQPEGVIPKQPRTTGLYHFALLLPTRADLARVLQHFVNISYPLQGASDHLVSEALYLADPDGNGIEIYSDRPADEWNWHNNEVEMTTQGLEVQNLLAEGEGVSWNGLPAGTLMGHIHLHVSEFAKTEEFYLKGLGFEIVCRYGGQALFISTGGYHHHIGLNTWNGVGAPAPSENSVGLKWFSLVYPNEQSRREAIERLQTMGASVKEEDGVVLTKDPSGTHIRLLV
ncbi:VOC family protein [Halalkalibacter nanhaiisediminis]|uniref:Catechol 2,3-dioxygenase n=1 Tax=Halalkalibacter nanhaiisediminis TaxID=688079 RepID=A0A562QDF8_9BACI|nr:VOC family protein [Halalkalibacter nanhaiisediminis]TWI54066.1 catechol 2,3-dioxygenase [Halalkalibacter nanhaiisediminis]